MPVFKPRCFTRLSSLACIRPESLLELLRPHRSFFTVHGLELPTGRQPPSLDLKKLRTILATHDLHHPPDLADALYYISEMATAEGMDALLPELAGDSAFGMFDTEPADVAVRVWLKNRELLERKHAQLCASRPRRFQYFQSLELQPKKLPKLGKAELAPLEAHLDDVFAGRGRGKGVRVMPFAGEDDCLLMVRHGDPKRREEVMDEKKPSVVYRPVKFDVVGYSVSTGTLRVYAQHPWEVSLYRNAFGQHLFGAMDHFSDTGRYTLEPLRGGDRSCLACLDAAPIKHVSLVEVHLNWGGPYDSVEVHRARDVFAAMKQRKTDVPAGPRIERATFEVFVFGQKQPRRVHVIPPNIARYSHEDESHVMDHWLGLRGFIKARRSKTHEQEPFELLRGR